MKGVITALVIFGATLALANDGVFDIRALPRGKSVTLPHTVSTHVPVAAKVRLGSTNVPQTLKITATHANGAVGKPFEVAIYDSHSEHVQLIKVSSKTPTLYIFKSLKPIQLVPKPAKGQLANGTMLKLESNHPLSISH